LDPSTEPSLSIHSLYLNHYGELVKMAALMVDDRHLGEEIVQDSFAEVVSRWAKINPQFALHYLRRTVINRSRSALRRRRTVRMYRPERRQDAPGADAAALKAEGFTAILAAIARLPTRQRQVVILRYYLGYSIAETAKALETSDAVVSTQANRAMTTLKKTREDYR
jgi:RNA polymerase sigma factor (sigma-70 family)